MSLVRDHIVSIYIVISILLSYSIVFAYSLNNELRPMLIRDVIAKKVSATGLKILSVASIFSFSQGSIAEVISNDQNSKRQLEYMPALQGLDYGKPRTLYPDFVHKPSGLQYKIIKEGNNNLAKKGDRVVLDWEGYTIGYYGRPFQTRNKVKGGAFDTNESDNFRFVVGSGNAIAAIEEAVQYIGENGVMQVIIPAELGYPLTGDPEHDIVGPKPTTFSGMRALNFVLDNKNMIDKTLLINIRVVRVDNDYASKKGINL